MQLTALDIVSDQAGDGSIPVRAGYPCLIEHLGAGWLQCHLKRLSTVRMLLEIVRHTRFKLAHGGDDDEYADQTAKIFSKIYVS